MKKFLSSFTLFLIFMMAPLFALQNDSKKPSWKILEQAQFCFDSGNYGEALRLSNLALNMHKNEIDSEYNILDIAVSPAQVKHAGDEFVNVLSVLEERESKEAISIINKYLALHGKIFFNDDIKIMLDWLKKKNVYPEADFLVGKIYQIEGEYDTAYKFYTKALDEGDYLDIPDEKYEILYSMAALLKQKKDYDSYEKTLLLIMDSDEYFKNELLQNALLRTIDTDEVRNVDRLFLLYRADAKYSLKAISELSTLYESKGEDVTALKYTALGTIESFTRMIETIKERDHHFSYTSYEDFLKECGKYPEILDWAQKNNIWQMMFLFADRVAKRGKLVFAQNLYIAMASGMPDSYYKQLASSRIAN